MGFETTEDALAYLEAIKLMFKGKPGFTHAVEDMDALQKHISELAEENRRLKESHLDS